MEVIDYLEIVKKNENETPNQQKPGKCIYRC